MIFGDDPRIMNEREDHWGRRFYTTAPDPWAIIQAGNLYLYCGSNPIMFVDPSGLAWKIVLKILETPTGKKAQQYIVDVSKWAGDQVKRGANWVSNTFNNLFGGARVEVVHTIASINTHTQHHIMHAKHSWGKVVADPNNWNQIQTIINDVMAHGVHGTYKGVFKSTMTVNNEVVQVVYNIVDGITRISNAWVVTR